MSEFNFDLVKANEAKRTKSFIKDGNGYYTPDGVYVALPPGIVRIENKNCWAIVVHDECYGSSYKSLAAAIDFVSCIEGLDMTGVEPISSKSDEEKPEVQQKGTTESPVNPGTLYGITNVKDRISEVIEPHIRNYWAPKTKVNKSKVNYIVVSVGKFTQTIYVGNETTYTKERFEEKLELARKVKAQFLVKYNAARSTRHY